jgi:amino acid transporter
MGLRELLIGKPLKTEEEQVEQIGPAAGIPVLGLDALGSASYGPEAALTVLLPLGAAASGYITIITAFIIALLCAVFFSYLQTIPAYPSGGGSYTVAKDNVGPFAGLLAAAALCIDYILNVAVAIAAGVGALVSAMPGLLPYTLWICLGLLLLLTVINLRGIRTTGLIFMLPTYLFVGTLLAAFGIGLVKAISAGGHPHPAVVLPAPAQTVSHGLGLWLLVHAFASGCTALTGIEAVSNAVPIFRKPTVRNAKITLSCLVVILATLLLGVAFLTRAYGITATQPGAAGYQSILSQIVSAVTGRGAFYYVTMFSIIVVLCLSANTSFAGFPRVCRVLALDEYLPAEFAHRGSRLVYTAGIIVLSILAATLLVVFGGVTDRLIPLFAVGAFGAFTMSQLGMVMHWRGKRDEGNRGKLILNAIGALATAVTLVIIVAAKFREGAWVVLLALPPVIFLFLRVRKYHAAVGEETESEGPLDVADIPAPIVVIPLKRLDGVGRKALRLALRLSPEVQAVQVLSDAIKTEDLEAEWKKTVANPAQEAGYAPPKLVIVTSVYREFYGPLLDYLGKLARENPGRPIGVMVPELVEKRWYHFLFRHRATFLKGLLLMKGGPQIFIINTPWYIEKHTALPQPEGEPLPVRVASA